MDGLAVGDREGFHGVPDVGEVLPLLGHQGFLQLVGLAVALGAEQILAEVPRHPEEPGFFMGRALQDGGCAEVLDERVLQDVLGVALVV